MSPEEFRINCAQLSIRFSRRLVKKLFDLFDRDKSGYLSWIELLPKLYGNMDDTVMSKAIKVTSHSLQDQFCRILALTLGDGFHLTSLQCRASISPKTSFVMRMTSTLCAFGHVAGAEQTNF